MNSSKPRKINKSKVPLIWGMTTEEYQEEVIKNGSSSIKGSPLNKYCNQRNNSLKRGIIFDITFPEWWEIWDKSGKWNERGPHAYNYVMGRIKDQGGYSVGNVYICTSHENSKKGIEWNPHRERRAARIKSSENVNGFYTTTKKDGSLRYIVSWKRKHLGVFDNPVDAKNAYLVARSIDYPEAPKE